MNYKDESYQLILRRLTMWVMAIAIFVFGASLAIPLANPPGLSVGEWLRKLAPSFGFAILLAFFAAYQKGRISFDIKLAHLPLSGLLILVIIGIGVGFFSVSLQRVDLFYAALVIFILAGALLMVYWFMKNLPVYGVSTYLLTLPFVSFFETSYSPVVYASFDFGPIVLTPVIGLTLLFLLSWFLARIITGKPIRAFPIGLAFLVFLLTALASTLFSIDPLTSYRRFFWSLLIPGLTFFVFANVASGIEIVAKTVKMTVISFGLATVFALYLYLKNPLFSLQGMIVASDFLREGIPYVTTFAQMVSMCIPLSLAASLIEKNLVWRTVLIINTIVMLLVLILSFSRTNLIGMLVAVSFILFAFRKTRWIPFLGALLIFILWSQVGFVHYVLSAKWEMSGGITHLTAYGNLGTRIESYKAALGMVRDHPLAGVGLGLYEDRFPIYGPPTLYARSSRWDISQHMLQAHNWWLNTVAESGLLGLFGLLVLTFATTRECILAWKNTLESKEKILVYGIVGSLISFLIANLTDTVALGLLKRITPGILFAIVVGCLSVIRVNQAKTQAK